MSYYLLRSLDLKSLMLEDKQTDEGSLFHNITSLYENDCFFQDRLNFGWQEIDPWLVLVVLTFEPVDENP